MGRQLQTVRTSGIHRLDAILNKASHAEDVQPSEISLHYPDAQTLLWKLCAAEV